MRSNHTEFRLTPCWWSRGLETSRKGRGDYDFDRASMSTKQRAAVRGCPLFPWSLKPASRSRKSGGGKSVCRCVVSRGRLVCGNGLLLLRLDESLAQHDLYAGRCRVGA